MDIPPNAFDFFVSYAHTDDSHGEITLLLEHLETQHRDLFPGRALQYFFDPSGIRTAHDWEHRIHDSLRASRLFLAILSPAYFRSEWCRREWQAWVDHEIARQTLGEAAFPIYVVEIPALTIGLTEQQIAESLTALDPRNAGALRQHFQQIHRRQFLEIKPFFPEGLDALRRGTLASTLATLARTLDEKNQLIRNARQSRSTIPPYNKRFVGRLDELQALRQLLGGDKAGIIASVHGLGGIGKTELALTYAHAYVLRYPGGRFLIPCERLRDLRHAILHLDPEFPGAATDEQRKSIDLHFRALCEAIRSRLEQQGPILLLLDNVTDLKLLTPEQTDALRLLGPDLHILATSRCETIRPDSASDYLRFLAIGELSPSDTLLLLEKHRPIDDEGEQDAARRIAHRLGGFALAVEVIGAYLAEHPGISYQAALEGMGLDDLNGVDLLAERADPDLRRHNHEKRLAAVLAPTLVRLTPAERDTLDFAALLPPDHIVLPWLRALRTGRDSQLSEEQWKAIVHRLHAFSLFARGVEGDGDARIVRCHRLVQSLRLKQMPEHDDRQAAVSALIHERIAHLEQTSQWEPARWEMPSLHALSQTWDEKRHPEAVWLMRHTGNLWHTLAEWPRAETLHRRALAIDETIHGSDHPEVASDLNNLSQILVTTNRSSEAEPLLRRALAINETAFDPGHPYVAVSLGNLAHFFKTSHRMAEAEPLMRRALAILEATLGPESREVAISLNNLAQLLQATNRRSEAEPLMRRALAIGETDLGPHHPEVALQLNNLAQLLRRNHQLSVAEPLLRRALQIVDSAYGPKHPQVAIALSNLSSLLRDLHRLVEAEPLMRRALDIVEANYGPEHPKVALELDNLAGLLQATHRMAEAEPLRRHALAIHEASLGPRHPAIAVNLNNLASLLQVTNRTAEAEPLLRRALAILETSCGPSHPDVASTLNSLASLLLDTNRVAEAEPLLRRSLAIDEASYGPWHPSVANRLNNLANLLQSTRRIAEAEPLIRRAVAIMERSHPPGHPNIGSALANYAHLLQATGRYSEAEPPMRRVVEIFEQALGPGHPNVAIALNNFAHLLQHTGRNAEAEPLMRRALTIDEACLGPEDPRIAIHLNNLAGLLRDTGRLPQTEPLLRRVIRILLRFTRNTGHFHPSLRAAVRNYATVIKQLENQQAVRPRLVSIAQEVGLEEETFHQILQHAFGN